jgi:hypothetical protein
MAALRGVDARIKSGQDGIATLTRAPGIRWVGEWDPLSRDPAERLADIIENVDSIGRDPPGINYVTKSRDKNCVFSLSALGGGEGRGEVGDSPSSREISVFVPSMLPGISLLQATIARLSFAAPKRLVAS